MDSNVKNILLVLSGKGGVGKSTVCVQVAKAMQLEGFKVGILDVDLCGPSIPRMLGVENKEILVHPQSNKWIPVSVDSDKRLTVVSMAFFLESKNDPVIWKGPKKNSMIQQLLSNIAWDVDYLLIDTPPGTSDEHIELTKNLQSCNVMGAIMVTTPQLVSLSDVLREVTFCRQRRIKVIGIIENMCGFVCPNCKECSNIFASGGGEILANKASVTFLGSIPLAPQLALQEDTGASATALQEDMSTCAFKSIVQTLLKYREEEETMELG